jgi:hypothetical protein
MTDCAYLNESVFDGEEFKPIFLEGFIKDCDLFIGLVTPTLVSRIMSNNNLTEFKQNFEKELTILKDVNNDINLRAKAMYNIIELCEENNNALKVTNFSFDKKNLCLNLFEPENKENLKRIKTEIFEKINFIQDFKAVLITYDDFVKSNDLSNFYTYNNDIPAKIFYVKNTNNLENIGKLNGYEKTCDNQTGNCINTFQFIKKNIQVNPNKIDKVFYVEYFVGPKYGGRTRKTRKPKTTRKKTQRKTTRKPKSMRRKTNTKSKKRK